MFLDASDHRPHSLLRQSSDSPGALAAGATMTLLVHGGVALTIGVVMMLSAAGLLPQAPAPEPEPLPEIIQARFLQRGETMDPRELPNRQVPILRTDTPDPVPTKRAVERPPPQRREPRQQNSVADALRRLSNDAQLFAEAEERRVQEGDPDGIEGGEREASEGDLYAGRLSVFLRRGWGPPVTISNIRQLSTIVAIQIGEDLQLHGFRVTRPSGNPDFDFSVTQQLQRLVDSHATIPPPPEEVAEQYLGRTRPFRFNGRDAR